jgi:pseudouridine synthase
MRINKYLAMKGFATRRGADELIERKSVTVNGRIAILGDKVTETDIVEVRKYKKIEDYDYYACHKPSGMNTEDTRKGQIGFSHSLPLKGVFPVGSLDREAAGLIIFTNDRRIIDRLENPQHPHPKTYLVESREPFRDNFRSKLEAGVSLEGGPTIPCRVTMKSPNLALVTISDTKNRIRAICSLFGAVVSKLTRTAILNVELGKLPPNGYRRIEGGELMAFMKSLGL